MLRILFTADDFALTRFLPEPAPLLEMKFYVVGAADLDQRDLGRATVLARHQAQTNVSVQPEMLAAAVPASTS